MAAGKRIDPRIEIIKRLLHQADKNPAWLSRQLEHSDPQKVYDWLKGKYGPRDPAELDRAIDHLNQTIGTKGPVPQNVPVFRRGTRFIPVYSGLPAGTAGASMTDVDYIEVMDWGSTFERWGRVIEGVSMEPLINPGETLVFEDRRAEHSHIVHAAKAGEDCCKVLWKTGEKPMLRSINPDYEDIEAEGWIIKGVAVQRLVKTPTGRITEDFDHGLRYRFEK